MNEEELQEEWLRRIRHAAREFELMPAEGSWQAIERGLRRRRRKRWLAMAAAWLLLLGAGGTAWWMLRHPSAEQPGQSSLVRQHPAAVQKPASTQTNSSSQQSPPSTTGIQQLPNLSRISRHSSAIPAQGSQVGKSPSTSDLVATPKNGVTPSSTVLWNALQGITLPFPRETLRNPQPVLQLPPGWGVTSNSTDTSQHRRSIAFRVAFAPGVGYRQLVQQATATPSPAQSFMRMPPSNYIPSSALGHDPAFSYLAGVEIQKPLCQHLVVGSGVQLLAFQYHIQAVNLSGAAYARNSTPMNISGGSPAQLSTVYGAYNPNALLAPDQYTTLLNQQVSIELPIFAGYQGKIFRRMQWQLTGGGGLDIALHQQQYVYVPAYQRYVADDNQLRRWNISTLMSGSLILPVGRGQIFMGPDLHYQLLNAYRHQPNLKENLYLISWKIGVIP